MSRLVSRRDAEDRESRTRSTRTAMPRLGPGSCPLEAMRDMHFVMRQVCLDMESLAAAGSAQPALALDVLVILCHGLPLHHADEDEDFFPLLRQRATDEDEIGRLLDWLSADHQACVARCAPLLAALACMADGALPAPEDRDALRVMARAERRHLTIENAIVLPLARVRLTDSDRAALLLAMAARRIRPFAAKGPCSRILTAPHRPDTTQTR